MSKASNLIGQRFGHLTVIGREENSKHNTTRWRCECDCGNEVVRGAMTLKKSTKYSSCGCIKKYQGKHGDYKTRLYNIWEAMKQRCFNERKMNYSRYGGRGITVCEKWLDYMKFKKWALDNGYGKNLTLDRINNDGAYCPENCRWITLSENSRQSSRNILNENLVKQIKLDWITCKNQMNKTEFAKKWRLKRPTMYGLLNGYRWKDVEPN